MLRSNLVTYTAAAALSLSASTAMAGEVTGNGKDLQDEDGLNGKSACAFSGQEDLQFQDEEGNPLPEPHKGEPAHAQSWGQIPKEFRDEIAEFGFHPGDACNPNVGEPTPEP